MKNSLVLTAAVAIAAIAATVFAAQGTSSPYTDATGDISSNISGGNPGGGTLDITGMEITETVSDLIFKLTVNGDVGAVDWGNFMVGIATYDPLGTASGNAWGRPINLQWSPDGAPFTGGMNYWLGGWVDGGGGGQVWSYDGAFWNGPNNPAAFSLTPGATSDIQWTVAKSVLNLNPGDSFSFDAYSSGRDGNPGAIDALANPFVTVNDWGESYTSRPLAFGGGGLNTYTLVPEPSTVAMASAGVLGGGLMLRRRKRRA